MSRFAPRNVLHHTACATTCGPTPWAGEAPAEPSSPMPQKIPEVAEMIRLNRPSVPCVAVPTCPTKPRNQPTMPKREADTLIDTQCRRWTVALRKRRFKSWRTRLFKGWSQHQTAAMIPWGDWSERSASVRNRFSFFADTRLPFIGPATRCN